YLQRRDHAPAPAAVQIRFETIHGDAEIERAEAAHEAEIVGGVETLAAFEMKQEGVAAEHDQRRQVELLVAIERGGEQEKCEIRKKFRADAPARLVETQLLGEADRVQQEHIREKRAEIVFDQLVLAAVTLQIQVLLGENERHPHQQHE